MFDHSTATRLVTQPAPRARSGRLGFLRRLVADRFGNIFVLAALTLPVLLGALGLGIESASWFQAQRAMQNASDAAAIAAASNGTSGYAAEAKAVTALYGFTDGASNTVVTVSNTASCPAGGSNCISVSITRPMALVLSAIVGFQGDTTSRAARAITVTARSVAAAGSAQHDYCIVALGSSGTGIAFQTNGAPKADLTGCSVMSNTGMDCNGHNLKATYGDAHGTNNGCGYTQNSNVPVYVDQYSSLASSIPANTCTSFPQKPASKKGSALPASNLISGAYSWGSSKTFCGDVQLSGDVTLSGSTAVQIVNGQLDTNGYSFKTASGASATLIFSGSNSATYTHAPTGGGTIDITAPTSGTWSGIAIYQQPSLTIGMDISAAGNSPTWNITGLVYLPKAAVTFSGAVNKSSNGNSCFVMVVDSILINGTANILSRGQCASSGLTMPASNLPSRGSLVA